MRRDVDQANDLAATVARIGLAGSMQSQDLDTRFSSLGTTPAPQITVGAAKCIVPIPQVRANIQTHEIEPSGRVYSASGSRVTVLFQTLCSQSGEDARPTTVGSFLTIKRQQSLIIGLTTDISFTGSGGSRPGEDPVLAKLDLLGAIRSDGEGKSHFRRGITQYPVFGDLVRLTSWPNCGLCSTSTLLSELKLATPFRIDQFRCSLA